jgi:hypothetical protein
VWHHRLFCDVHIAGTSRVQKRDKMLHVCCRYVQFERMVAEVEAQEASSHPFLDNLSATAQAATDEATEQPSEAEDSQRDIAAALSLEVRCLAESCCFEVK